MKELITHLSTQEFKDSSEILTKRFLDRHEQDSVYSVYILFGYYLYTVFSFFKIKNLDCRISKF